MCDSYVFLSPHTLRSSPQSDLSFPFLLPLLCLTEPSRRQSRPPRRLATQQYWPRGQHAARLHSPNQHPPSKTPEHCCYLLPSVRGATPLVKERKWLEASQPAELFFRGWVEARSDWRHQATHVPAASLQSATRMPWLRPTPCRWSCDWRRHGPARCPPGPE